MMAQVEFNPEIARINTYTDTNTVMGWEIGVIYYSFFGSFSNLVLWWQIIILMTVGAAIATFIFANSLKLIAAGVTKIGTGSGLGGKPLFMIAAVVGPILGFWASGKAVEFFI